MQTLIWILHILFAITLVVLVLLQHGKGADMGAAFGSGASGSLFGSSGSANFLSRTTAVLATLFFLTSIALTYFSLEQRHSQGIMGKIPTAPVQTQGAPAAPPAPAVPAPAAPVNNGASKAGEIPK